MRTFKRETDLARVVVQYLRTEGFEVWQEVDGHYDILATKHNQLWAIETKLTLGTPVLAQAWQRAQDVHFVSVATPPSPKHRLQRRFLEKVATNNGIGILRVTHELGVQEHIKPRLRRTHRSAKLIKRLRDIPQDYAPAGTNRGGYWTNFRGTCDRVIEFVGRNPGCTIAEVVANVPHHYASKASAKARLTLMCEQGVVDVDTVRQGKELVLYPRAQ